MKSVEMKSFNNADEVTDKFNMETGATKLPK